MLIFDFIEIGNKLYYFRKKVGMTQAEVAESAGISDRTYADIERGTVNMRVETLLRICSVLKITPNDILLTEAEDPVEDLSKIIGDLSPNRRKTAIKILEAYIKGI